MIADDCNHARYRPGQAEGHYESYFQRANHPTRPLAFWIRYTIFSPAGRAGAAIGELWAMVFNGETGRHVVAKSELPIGQCRFDTGRFEARVGAAVLEPGRLTGRAESAGQTVSWDLTYSGSAKPVFLLPLAQYAGGFPKAKSLVGVPMASYSGALTVNGERLDVERWIGSQNHNWGVRHTDRYAYGQVCSFDNAPESFLEMASAKLRFGAFWTPTITPVVLRHRDREYAVNTLWQGLRAAASYDYFRWRFQTEDRTVRIEGEIQAPKDAFVGLRYYNPPGGEKWCLNSKIAACTVSVMDKQRRTRETLVTRNRAAFEILTDDLDHGVEIRT